MLVVERKRKWILVDRVHLDRLRFSCLRYPALANACKYDGFTMTSLPELVAIATRTVFQPHEMTCWQTLMLRTAKDRLSALGCTVHLIDRFRLFSIKAIIEPLGHATRLSSFFQSWEFPHCRTSLMERWRVSLMEFERM